MNLSVKYKEEAKSRKLKYKSYTGEVNWQSPSNIALVKYWGKKDIQLPMNPSVSLTLKNSNTNTHISFEYDSARKNYELQYFFDGELNPDFKKRIEKYLDSLILYMPFINSLKLSITSSNSFPHSSGIASSASAFSALALCLVDIENILTDSRKEIDFFRKASFIARLGSGSAARSVCGGINLWGQLEEMKNSSDEFAISITESVDPVYATFQDIILLIDQSGKKVSSSKGHDRLKENPYAKVRYAEAYKMSKSLLKVMQGRELFEFMDLIEYEALSLHAMMLTSYPGYILLKPRSLEIIEKVREYRHSENVPIGFTIDAGANVHLLFPVEFRNRITEFIRADFPDLFSEQRMIYDEVGNGPVKLIGN
jgi:diphosphomevalonate decarboxylase